MSVQHPIIAVTGMAGAGLSTVRHAFKAVFERLGVRPAIVHGDGFRRYTDNQFAALLQASREGSGETLSWFGPDCNHFTELETFFRSYAATGNGLFREYAHNDVHAARLGVGPGQFTPWKPLPESDLLLYEGQHGGVVAQTWTRRRTSVPLPAGVDRRSGQRGIDVAQHVDYLIGVAPAINLEWIQKIHRDCAKGYCSAEASVETILRRMEDYARYIVPQFALTDLNIQRMPLVDTSNPFVAREVPNPDESFLVVHFRDKRKYDLVSLLQKIPGSFMSRSGTMVAPGGELKLLLEMVCAPVILEMMEKRRAAS